MFIRPVRPDRFIILASLVSCPFLTLFSPASIYLTALAFLLERLAPEVLGTDGGYIVPATGVGDELATGHLLDRGANIINGLNEASCSQLLVDTLSLNE